MNKTKRKIAIIGYGAIADYVFSKLKSEKIIIDHVICRKGKEKKAKAVFKNNVEAIAKLLSNFNFTKKRYNPFSKKSF